jgi:D-alanyl-D-alanine carboxypeptidase/D-alanyl-D-alanine-endopeptidase (penicillin-binding protein 4)
VLIICSTANLVAAADLSAADQIKAIVDKALTHPYMAHGVQGVLIRSMDTGKVIYDHNGDMLLIPASNMKLIATSAAFEVIGPDFTMMTSLYASTKPTSGGVVKGDLVLVGQGDSILKIEHLQQMVDKLKAMGVRRINGNIVGDDTWFDNQGMAPGWAWDDEQYNDCSQPSGLNVNENLVEVFVRPGAKAGDPAVVEVKPANTYMPLVNQCVTGPAGSNFTADATRSHGLNTIRTYGSVPLDSKRETPVETLSMNKPTLFVCSIFKQLLEQSGVKVRGGIMRGVKPQQAELIATHVSPPLSEVIHILLKPSDNFMAECVLKTLGKVVKGQGSFDAGIEVEKEWLKGIGADLSQIYISDSSGQSRRNLISPYNLVVLLTHMYHTKYYEMLANSLPIAGVDSHLKYRMLNTPAVNNVKAKTGYIERQCSLSGYVKTLAGENMAVSVIQNNHLCSLEEAYVMQDIIFTAVSEITTRSDADEQKK